MLLTWVLSLRSRERVYTKTHVKLNENLLIILNRQTDKDILIQVNLTKTTAQEIDRDEDDKTWGVNR